MGQTLGFIFRLSFSMGAKQNSLLVGVSTTIRADVKRKVGEKNKSAHYSLIDRAQLLTGTYTHYPTQLFPLCLISISLKDTTFKKTT